MSQNSCCVPGCVVVRKDGVPLHRFPNPDREREKFTTWILNIGGEIALMDHQDIYHNRRVCHRHFDDVYRYPSGRLSKLAIPTMHNPDLQAQSLGEAMVMSKSDTSQRSQLQKCGFNTSGIELIDALSTSTLASILNIETIISKPALAAPNVEAIISKPPLASTSNSTQSNNLNSGPIQPGQSKCRERKIKATKSKSGGCVTLGQYKEFKSVLKKLQKCESDKKNFKTKYMMAKKMKKTTAFNIVCKNMPHSRKLFCQMQASQSGKKKKGRRFTLDEKILALSLYKPSPKAYRLLSKICVLPSRRTLQDLLHKVNLKPGINENNI